MNFPDRAVALEWVGRSLVDRNGARIGTCTAVFADDATQVTEWICSEFDGATVLIPAVGAVESNGDVQVVVSRSEIAAAPSVGGDEHIAGDDEVALYQHYGIPFSRDASATVLPSGDVTSQPSKGVTPNAIGLDRSATPSVAEPVAVDPLVNPVVADPVASLPLTQGSAATQSILDEEAGEPTGEASASGRGWLKPVVGGLAAVALTVSVLLRSRRRRQQRATAPTERLADRGRAASVALSARTGQAAASASRYLKATQQIVRRRAGADEMSVDLPVDSTLQVTAVRDGSSGGSA